MAASDSINDDQFMSYSRLNWIEGKERNWSPVGDDDGTGYRFSRDIGQAYSKGNHYGWADSDVHAYAEVVGNAKHGYRVSELSTRGSRPETDDMTIDNVIIRAGMTKPVEPTYRGPSVADRPDIARRRAQVAAQAELNKQVRMYNTIGMPLTPRPKSTGKYR